MGTKKLSRWAFNKFKEQYAELLYLSISSTGETLKKIDQTLDVMRGLFYSFERSDLDIKTMLTKDAEMLKSIEEFRHLITPLSREIDFDFIEKNVFFPKINDEDYFSLIHDFFKEALDRELFKIFSEMFKKRNDLVHLYRLGGNGKEAASFFFPYYRQVHILLRRSGKIKDFSDLSHEYGHGLQYLMNYDPAYLLDDMYFAEIVSTFFELLNLEYMKKYEEFKRSAIKEQAGIFMEYCDASILLNEEAKLLDHYSHLRGRFGQKLADLEVLLEKDLDEIDFKEIDVEELLRRNLPCQFSYILSYLFAIELLELYRKDRDYALFVLKNVIDIDLALPNREYLKELLSLGLMPGSHLTEYESYVIKPKSSIF